MDRGIALIPLLQTALNVFPLLASTHPFLGQPQLLRGFKVALDSGHLAMGWQQDKRRLPMAPAPCVLWASCAPWPPNAMVPLIAACHSSWAVLAAHTSAPPNTRASASPHLGKLLHVRKRSSLQYEGFLPQAVPVRSSSAPCLTSQAGSTGPGAM